MAGLYEQLEAFGAQGVYPFHMPGHKRRAALAPYLDGLGARLDVTEIPDFDDLHAPQGFFRAAQARAARLWGSEEAHFLVGGSTSGILAAVQAATRRGDAVLVARNCHKAVYHALALCGLRPVYVQPDVIPCFGCAASISAAAVEEILDAQAEIRLLIVTSPSYEGVLCDMAALVTLAHARGLAVLVDEAHGAHLGLGGEFPASAVSFGADLVVQSLHKTLPSLTQTAILHVQGALVSKRRVKRALGVFLSSSPSYLLLASIEGCVALLEERGAALLADASARLARFYARAASLRHLRLLSAEALGVFALDASKIVISTAGTKLSGVQLSEMLRAQFGLQLEMATEQYAIAMTSLADDEAALDALCDALLCVDAGLQSVPMPCFVAPLLPQRVLAMEEAEDLPAQLVPLAQAAGHVAAEGLWAYPPGAPILLAGERISAALVEMLLQMAAVGVSLQTGRGALAQGIFVLAEP